VFFLDFYLYRTYQDFGRRRNASGLESRLALRVAAVNSIRYEDGLAPRVSLTAGLIGTP
jgi:hypothetical protein